MVIAMIYGLRFCICISLVFALSFLVLGPSSASSDHLTPTLHPLHCSATKASILPSYTRFIPLGPALQQSKARSDTLRASATHTSPFVTLSIRNASASLRLCDSRYPDGPFCSLSIAEICCSIVLNFLLYLAVIWWNGGTVGADGCGVGKLGYDRVG
jgi:hypothetical protein